MFVTISWPCVTATDLTTSNIKCNRTAGARAAFPVTLWYAPAPRTFTIALLCHICIRYVNPHIYRSFPTGSLFKRLFEKITQITIHSTISALLLSFIIITFYNQHILESTSS